jgi:hypothetical protein
MMGAVKTGFDIRTYFSRLPGVSGYPSFGGFMKKPAIWIVLTLLLAVISFRATGQQQNNTPMSFTGDIMDNECAAQGTHEAMMQKEGFKTSKDCTLGCVKAGGQFVLYGSGDKKIYQLDDEEKPKDYAGQKVSIIGTYDGETKTIHVQTIQAVP